MSTTGCRSGCMVSSVKLGAKWSRFELKRRRMGSAWRGLGLGGLGDGYGGSKGEPELILKWMKLKKEEDRGYITLWEPLWTEGTCIVWWRHVQFSGRSSVSLARCPLRFLSLWIGDHGGSTGAVLRNSPFVFEFKFLGYVAYESTYIGFLSPFGLTIRHFIWRSSEG